MQLQVRHVDGSFEERAENEWPVARTGWTRLYLNAAESLSLDRTPPEAESEVEFDALSDGLTFTAPPLEKEVEITGPLAAKLFVSSSTVDADLFLVVRVFDQEDREVVFQGALDPNTPVAQGWLRASHRKLDTTLSEEWRPYHTHDEEQPLQPGELNELDIEIWPTCIVVPAGYRISLTVRGKDYEHPGEGARLASFVNEMRGCGPFLHNDPRDRPADIFGGTTTIYSGGNQLSYVLLPIIPDRREEILNSGEATA